MRMPFPLNGLTVTSGESFGLPADKFLFLLLYDLNSYSERKNPAAALEAFHRSGLAGQGAALVIKVHNVAGNPTDYKMLCAAAAALPDATLIYAYADAPGDLRAGSGV